MSAITIENDLVHYEVLGRGRPVIFIHGWLGSWRYWVPTMQQLSMKYRTYALDLWGFGDSGKDANRYGLKDQVQLLHDFFERLGIPKAALIGHSFGAAVCLNFARQYPERVHRMMLISPPLFDVGGLGEEQTAQAPVATVPAPAVPVTDPANPAVITTPALPVTPAVPAAAAPVAPTTTTPPAPPASPVVPPTSTAPATTSPSVVPPATPIPPPVAPATSTTPATPPAVPATSTAPATPPPAAAKATPAVPPPATPSPATPPAANTPPAAREAVSTLGAAYYSATSETIPRNPFRTRGETPEEILARLRAKNMSTSGQPSTPTGPTTQSTPTPAQGPTATPKPSTPVLPSSIAKPILPTTGSLTPASPTTAGSAASPVPAPARPADASANPLLPILTGIKPAALLIKHVDRDIPDLDTLRTEVEKTDENALLKSAQSFASVNLALELKRLATPTLLLHGENDSLLPPPSEDLLRRINTGKLAGHFLTLVEPELRHFPMLEVTAKFNRLLIDFLEAPDLTNVQFKDQWKRTMR